MSDDIVLFGRTQTAEQTPFDNSDNSFEATNVQDAIEEAARQTNVQTYLDTLRVLAEGSYKTENGRSARIVSTDRGFVTIIENAVIVKSDGSTSIESGATLRIT